MRVWFICTANNYCWNVAEIPGASLLVAAFAPASELLTTTITTGAATSPPPIIIAATTTGNANIRYVSFFVSVTVPSNSDVDYAVNVGIAGNNA